jgi:hypothetical protein
VVSGHDTINNLKNFDANVVEKLFRQKAKSRSSGMAKPRKELPLLLLRMVFLLKLYRLSKESAVK